MRRAAHRATLCAALALCGAPGGPAAAVDRCAGGDGGTFALDELFTVLAARRHGHVRYSETQTLASLSRPLHSSGELVYEAPDRLEMRVLEPQPQDLLLERGVLQATRNGRRRTLSLASAPQMVPFIESIRATLAGDRAALERYFTPTLRGTRAHWSLALAPDPSLAGVVDSVRIDGEDDALRTIEIRRKDGDASLLTLGPDLGP